MKIPDGKVERKLTTGAALAWAIEIVLSTLIGLEVVDDSWRALTGIPLGIAITLTIIRVSHGRMSKILVGVFQAGAAAEREKDAERHRKEKA